MGRQCDVLYEASQFCVRGASCCLILTLASHVKPLFITRQCLKLFILALTMIPLY